jgi:two-component system sensor histidine kinase VicK
MATVVAVLWLSIATFGVYSVRAQMAVANAALDAQAATLANNLALGSESALILGDVDSAAQLIRRAASLPQVLDIAVFDIHGVRLSHVVREPGRRARTVPDASGMLFTLPQGESPVAHHEAAAGYVTAWHPVKAGTLLGWVRVDLSLAEVAAAQRKTSLGAVVACLLAGLAATLALHLVLRKPLRAIQQARDFAEGLQFIEGQQLTDMAGPQETQDLAHSLNRASANLLQMRQTMDASLARMRRHEATLADTNEQLRTIFALSPDALVCFDDIGRVSYTNPVFHQMTGLPPALVLGQPAVALEMRLRALCKQPAEFPGLEQYFNTHVAVGQGHRLMLARPQPIVLEVMGALSDAPSVRRLLYLRDITHESEVDRMKSEFLSTAAHELRTPMTSIHACIELLMSRDFNEARRQQMLAVMQRQSLVLMQVVNELLDLARIEARGAAGFNLEACALEDVLELGVHDFALPLGRSAPQMDFPPQPLQLPQVRIDRDKTAQVLRNLLSNAYKYSPPGSGVSLRLLLDSARARAGFEVQDHGVGMSPEQLARVGERFYRADTSGHVAGTGLGVSIVREIVSLMNGELVLHSELGVGTRATVWLPLAEQMVGTLAEPRGQPDVQPARAQTTLATIAAT